MSNNQTLKKIGVGIDGHTSTKLNLKRNVNTTMTWGDLEPLMVEEMIPNQTIKMKHESLTRLAPVVTPCFGDISYKTISMFCPIEELMPTFNAFMAGQEYAGMSITHVPRIQANMLSCLPLIGSTMSVWYCKDSVTGGLGNAENWIFPSSSSSSIKTSLVSWLNANVLYFSNNVWMNQSSLCLDLSHLIADKTSHSSACYIPISNNTIASCMSEENVSITPSNADMVVFTCHNSLDGGFATVAFCFRFSDLGKRYYKLLRGLKYNIDISDDRAVSLLPLMAYWRVYFEAYGIRHWKNFEQTNLFKIINLMRSSQPYALTPFHNFWINTNSDFWKFFRDLGQMWYTDPMDFVAANQAKVTEGFGDSSAMGPMQTYLNSGFVDVHQGSIFSFSPDATNNNHLAFNAVDHGYIDEQLLKIAYKWTNRQDIIGGDIAKQLKAMGQGNVEDECPVAFIGATSVDVNIMDVAAFADTFNEATDEGKLLGEFAGKGVKYDEGKVFKWTANKYGYWVTMAVMVPDGSYCQQADRRNYAVSRFDFYQPEFDGLGMQPTTKSEIVSCPVGSIRIGTEVELPNNGSLKDTFGYIPRSTEHKISQNVVNGEFSLNSRCDNYSAYHLDKFMSVGKMVLGAPVRDSSGNYSASVVDGGWFFNVANLPNAGTWWYYNSKYKWMANYNRIFANVGRLAIRPSHGPATGWSENISEVFDLISRNDDNFIVHNVIYVDSEKPVKPLALSFGTFDEDKGANGENVKA